MFKYLILFLIPLFALAQYDYEIKITGPQPRESLSMGGSLALKDSNLIMSASDNTYGDYSGSCYSYAFDGDWNFIQKIFSPDIQAGDRFGRPYFINNMLFIGASGDEIGNMPFGAFYAFENEDPFPFKYKIQGDVLYGKFGGLIVGKDSLLVVTAGAENDFRGAVYIYKFYPDTAYVLQRLSPVELEESDGFGRPAITERYIAIGTPEDNNDYGLSVGVVYLYEQDSLSGLWDDYKIIYSPNPDMDQFFGRSVHFQNEYLFIGEPGDIFADNPGSLHVYKYNVDSSNWAYHQELTSGYGYRERFGFSIATNDSLLLVGAIEDSVNGIASVGSAYLFSLKTDGYWQLKKRFVPSDGKSGDRFGWDVEMNKEFVAISANWADVNGYTNSGAVYVYSDHPTSLNDHLINPEAFELFQNYPNPFNPSTKINYNLVTKSHIKLSIYDITGRKIKTLVNQQQSVGRHSISFDASGLASGIYIYKLKADSFVQSRKMLLVR